MIKTTYILHGGSAQHKDLRNDLFFREILEKTGLENVKILLVHFAGSPERLDTNREIDSGQFDRNKSGRKLTFNIAHEKEFVKQIKRADVVYFGGGTTIRLLEVLKKYNNLRKAFSGKVVAGESAGANFLSVCCFSKSGGGIIEGLGILPIFIYPHFEKGTSFIPESIPEGLEKIFLPNYKYRVIETSD